MKTLDWSDTAWRKSSRSGDTGGQCVEVAAVSPMVTARDAAPTTDA
ncbi:hypothetical protein GCM10023196_090390 [Actinoallomurus vinaceus]|uniref:DUF397 domain-containing protein n=1 Tax=Actinoallomurus vinaceus TaxID=1080074 RepID=A0ABP8UPU4_9ACTN